MEYTTLGRTGVSIPVLGLGTWGIGGGMRSDRSNDELGIQSLRFGLDLGMSFIDTAEMYGGGHSEEIVASAMSGRRTKTVLATKVSPQHFAYDNVLCSAQKSIERLKIRQIDLYQLHWPNPGIEISETMKAMEKLVHEGLVKHIGVSNFDVDQVNAAQSALSTEQIVSNQVEFSVLERSPEENGILKQCQSDQLTLIAYSPFGQARLFHGKGVPFDHLDEIARKHGKTRGQVALNWLLQKGPVVAIPKAAAKDHISENLGALGWQLDSKEIDQIGKAFEQAN